MSFLPLPSPLVYMPCPPVHSTYTGAPSPVAGLTDHMHLLLYTYKHESSLAPHVCLRARGPPTRMHLRSFHSSSPRSRLPVGHPTTAASHAPHPQPPPESGAATTTPNARRHHHGRRSSPLQPAPARQAPPTRPSPPPPHPKQTTNPTTTTAAAQATTRRLLESVQGRTTRWDLDLTKFRSFNCNFL